MIVDINLFIRNTFHQLSPFLPCNDIKKVKEIRLKAFEEFEKSGLSANNHEEWKNSPIQNLPLDNYKVQLAPFSYYSVDEIFKCRMELIASNRIILLNGWYFSETDDLITMPNGVIYGSINAAINKYPELVIPHLDHYTLNNKKNLSILNKALFTDGVFVYVPDNVNIKDPIQIINLVKSTDNLLIHNRNLIIVGNNSHLQLILCNDSICSEKSVTNNVTLIYLNENSYANLCKMENKDMESVLIDHVLVSQKKSSKFISNSITFNAGYLRNNFDVQLQEPFADLSLNGLYLVDKKQIVDNQIYVNHAAPDCHSKQLYKGIVDDKAYSNFNGHVFVAKEAQKTIAYQSSKNIALTDEVRITNKPFLEIYADDVTCGHGATIGQLNQDELFYLKSRGICDRNAKMLLMYAFAKEALSLIDIDFLKEKLENMITMRLRGDLKICEGCISNCIDMLNLSFNIANND